MSGIRSRRRRGLLLAFVAGVGALVVASPVLADDFSQGNGANAAANWKAYVRTASGYTLTTTVASSSTAGISFDFQPMPDPSVPQGSTSFFATTHPGDLLGDLTGKTLTATFTISETDPAFTYYGYGQSWNEGTTPASVRLYFHGNTTGTFDPADYWWSNPASATLASLVGNTVTLTVSLDGTNWSDYYGKLGTAVPDQFAASVADVTMIGLSFGGGSFFSNGVGLSSGSATFTLSSFSAR